MALVRVELSGVLRESNYGSDRNVRLWVMTRMIMHVCLTCGKKSTMLWQSWGSTKTMQVLITGLRMLVARVCIIMLAL